MARHLNFKDKIFRIQSTSDFESVAVELCNYQLKNNAVYSKYVNVLGVEAVTHFEEIPFLPIRFFKQFEVKTGTFEAEAVFTSSGTTGMETSKHFVKELSVYEESYLKAFRMFYGNPEDYFFAALLPSYLERTGSSLIDMCKGLIQLSQDEDSGFFLNEYRQLCKLLQKKKIEGKKVFLIGVTFGLLDFAEQFSMDLSGAIIMETGGMKGRRKEMIRKEVHQILTKAFNVSQIHSEYGMTELLSQAYSDGNGFFKTPPWIDIQIRSITDPFQRVHNGKTGGINVIDLANIHSCAFIETQDLGRKNKNALFEVMGRFDDSDVRGCNLMVV